VAASSDGDASLNAAEVASDSDRKRQLLTGFLIGVIGGAFRYLLTFADLLRGALVCSAHAHPYVGWILPVGFVALAAAVARLLVIGLHPQRPAAVSSASKRR